MSKKVLVLKDKMDRAKLAGELQASGARITSDSGGKVVVIDVPDDKQEIVRKKLPKVQLLGLDQDIKKAAPKLDENEKLFVDALKLRTSPAYIEAKKARKPGSTPEEKEFFAGPHVIDEGQR